MRKTFAELKLAVARLCSDVSNNGKSIAGDMLIHIQDKIQRANNWSFLLQHSAEVKPLVAGTHIYDTPDDWEGVNFVYYLDTDGSPVTLDPISDEGYFDKIDETDYDTPLFYRLLGMGDNHELRIQIGPPPSAAFLAKYGTTLYIEQYDEISTLVNEGDYSDFPGDFSLVLEFGAAYLMSIKQGNITKALGFKAEYLENLRELIAKDRLRYKKLFRITPTASAAAIPWGGRGTADYGR